MGPAKAECFISVDVETSGPIPGRYSMLALGACVVGRAEEGFYAEFKPLNNNAVPEALSVSGLDLGELARRREEPEAAMRRFAGWVRKASAEATPVFLGLNAGFDWSFVNWYFHEFLAENPFGFAPADIKSYYMGLTGCNWEDTRSSRLRPEFQAEKPATHHALDDARAQARMFEKMRAARQ
jgi:DNA polymerase III epsilon subunit-like protein